MNRPTGVSIIAILQFFGAAFWVCVALLSFVGGGFLATILQQQGRTAGAMAGVVGAVLGVIALFISTLGAVLGWGNWNLKDWARLVTIVFCALGVLFGFIGVIRSLLHPAFLIWSLIRIGIAGAIAWYLMQPHVVAAYKAADQRPQQLPV